LKKSQPETTEIQQFILQVLEREKPENVEKLVKLVQQELPLPREKVIENILGLQSEGKIKLTETVPPIPSILAYLHSGKAYWYWTTIILAIITTILVFTVPEDAYPFIYARYILGSIFVLWMPGYAFIKALFPTKLPIQTSSPELDNLERIALSIGMSLALVPIMGLLLNYTPWGIRLTPITLSLLALTLTFATVAVIREHQTKMKRARESPNILTRSGNQRTR
jgi:hypothetical protein